MANRIRRENVYSSSETSEAQAGDKEKPFPHEDDPVMEVWSNLVRLALAWWDVVALARFHL